MCCENGVLEQLRQRRSVRAFTGEPIPEETRNAILEAAAQAPTAGNQQIVSIDRYPDQTPEDRRALFDQGGEKEYGAYMRAFCARKYNSAFSGEMTRSVGVYLKDFEE